jgi:hypothetical protein
MRRKAYTIKSNVLSLFRNKKEIAFSQYPFTSLLRIPMTEGEMQCLNT